MIPRIGDLHFSWCFMVGAIVLGAVLVPTAAQAQPVACDVNGDGTVDAIDVQLVINGALGLEVPVGDGQEVIVDGTDPLVTEDDFGFAAEPTADFTASPTFGDAPLTVQFTDTSTVSSGRITSWFWDFGDTGSSTEQNPSHVYTGVGVYTVSLSVLTDKGKSDSVTKTGLITALEPAQQEVTWVSPQDGDWNDPANWSTGAVPSPSQLAIVDPPGEPITVTVSADASVGDLQMEDNLVISGGTFTVSGDAVVNGGLTVTNNALLLASGSEASLTANGPTEIDNARLAAREGGIISLPSATSYSWNINEYVNPTIFEADGAGSLCRVSVFT